MVWPTGTRKQQNYHSDQDSIQSKGEKGDRCARACHVLLEIANHALEKIPLGIIHMTPVVMCIAALTSLKGFAADVVTTPVTLLMAMIRRHGKCNQNGGE